MRVASIQSMTGFGSVEAKVAAFGKISIELRSTNHKFLEIVFHLPEGFLFLEDRIKKEIEAKIKRGRLICNVTVSEGKISRVFLNKALLKNYLAEFKGIKKEFRINHEIDVNTLIHLPGVLSLSEDAGSKAKIWPHLRGLILQALADLVKVRKKEGSALAVYLKQRTESLSSNLSAIKARSKIAIVKKLSEISTDEERSSFLKATDINEEIERLGYHIKSFKNTLRKSGPIGKELDFIAQEMQRETNTMGAKTFDAAISGKVVEIKSQIEKIREQVQNIE